MSINNDLIEIALNSPITEEQWDAITDVDFEHANKIWFHTKHGKIVEFAKVVLGHWENTPIPIWLRNNTTRTYYFKCNKCSSTSWNRDNYCSHCGAKMDEVTE